VAEAVACVALSGLFLLAAGPDAVPDGGDTSRAGMPGVPGVRPAAVSARQRTVRLAGGLAVLAIVAAAAGLGGPRLAYAHARAPFTPRLPAPVAPSSPVSPLDEVSAWLAAPGTVLFDARMSAPQNLRLAVLDQFDGQDWSSDAGYLPTGSRVPPLPGQSAAASVTVTQQITIGALASAWLPAVAGPAAVTGTTVDVDPAGGELLDVAGLRPGLAYHVVSEVPQYSATQLRDAVPADDTVARAALSLPPGVPAVIAQTARRATAGAGFPYQQAARLAAWLRSACKFVPDAPPGHTYGHIAYFLGRSHQGTSEQFAVAYALMARSLGLPSRVAVGFRPGVAGPGGVRVITGADVLVWPEIDFSGLGWVPFYPTPGSSGPGSANQVFGAGESAQRQRVDQSLAAAQLPRAAPASPARPRHAAGPAGRPLWPDLLLVLPALAVAALLGYLALALVLPWRRSAAVRSAALRAGQPGNGNGAPDVAPAVAGVWLETVRRMRAAGLTDVASRTCSEVAAYGTGRLGEAAGVHLTQLATLADGCEFGQLPPDPAAARAAWQHHDVVRSAIRASVPALALARHRLRPGVVFGRGSG
jgi:transglutaminase-like putative cysteine protease